MDWGTPSRKRIMESSPVERDRGSGQHRDLATRAATPGWRRTITVVKAKTDALHLGTQVEGVPVEIEDI